MIPDDPMRTAGFDALPEDLRGIDADEVREAHKADALNDASRASHPQWRIVHEPWGAFPYAIEQWDGNTWRFIAYQSTQQQAEEHVELRRAGPTVVKEYA